MVKFEMKCCKVAKLVKNKENKIHTFEWAGLLLFTNPHHETILDFQKSTCYVEREAIGCFNMIIVLQLKSSGH